MIGSIWSMKQRGIDFKKKCLLVGQDIDIRCVWMAYIQLCLYEVPAVVIHANTLTMEMVVLVYTVCIAALTKKEAYMNNTLVIVVKRHGSGSLQLESNRNEIIDLDCNGSDPNAEYEATERLKAVRQYLYKLY